MSALNESIKGRPQTVEHNHSCPVCPNDQEQSLQLVRRQ